MKKRNCTIRVAKTKTLISFAGTAKLICVFVFAYADCWFSHEVAHISLQYQRSFKHFKQKAVLRERSSFPAKEGRLEFLELRHVIAVVLHF